MGEGGRQWRLVGSAGKSRRGPLLPRKGVSVMEEELSGKVCMGSEKAQKEGAIASERHFLEALRQNSDQ